MYKQEIWIKDKLTLIKYIEGYIQKDIEYILAPDKLEYEGEIYYVFSFLMKQLGYWSPIALAEKTDIMTLKLEKLDDGEDT